jgi:hypothetical protein
MIETMKTLLYTTITPLLQTLFKNIIVLAHTILHSALHIIGGLGIGLSLLDGNRDRLGCTTARTAHAPETTKAEEAVDLHGYCAEAHPLWCPPGWVFALNIETTQVFNTDVVAIAPVVLTKQNLRPRKRGGEGDAVRTPAASWETAAHAARAARHRECLADGQRGLGILVAAVAEIAAQPRGVARVEAAQSRVANLFVRVPCIFH